MVSFKWVKIFITDRFFGRTVRKVAKVRKLAASWPYVRKKGTICKASTKMLRKRSPQPKHGITKIITQCTSTRARSTLIPVKQTPSSTKARWGSKLLFNKPGSNSWTNTAQWWATLSKQIRRLLTCLRLELYPVQARTKRTTFSRWRPKTRVDLDFSKTTKPCCNSEVLQDMSHLPRDPESIMRLSQPKSRRASRAVATNKNNQKRWRFTSLRTLITYLTRTPSICGPCTTRFAKRVVTLFSTATP